ncbi:MAG TPA: DUF5700 domain-containing putative Zn-dependent protease [Clostridia bacterium]|nr:DUF5700 domain-containing putative Zn-dependent protease [Clostridia bacterium]
MRDFARYLLLTFLVLVISSVFVLPCRALTMADGSRISIKLDTSEAEAVLAILDKACTQQPIAEADWQRIFSSEPYVSLKRREHSMKRSFEDDVFQQYVLSPETVKRTDALRYTLEAWKGANLIASARQVLKFLPAGAKINATVYPVIKPRENSFVFEDNKIFLYLDPTRPKEVFLNTVTHELHHIGMGSVETGFDERYMDLSPNARKAGINVGRFAEGFAMLAAAGSADVHPHQFSDPKDRARWDRDMANFNTDLKKVEQFLLDVLNGRFASDEEMWNKAFEFYGEQGPWYTLGYKMAAAVEKKYGRAALLECEQDPRRLLATWNVIAAEQSKKDEQLATWSPELINGLHAQPVQR